ncbi:MAG: NUDIX domain-containing protein, partial [Streptococcaceae bacterium]|jgi:A/G-specific adenine glycosylase|nr:NUDIX domain-containing protein [Streptococcaceae bacterium]
MRVVSRLFEIEADIAKASSRKVFDEYMRTIISHKAPGNFNQAMMDLGSSICTPTSPKCSDCPIQTYCLANKNGNMLNFPVKSKKIKQKPLYFVALAMKNKQGQYYLEKRGSKGLLANMWTFPLIEVTKEQYQNIEITQFTTNKNYVFATQPKGEITHIFSHLKWHVKVFVGFEKDELTVNEEIDTFDKKWLGVAEHETTVFPKPQLKMFDLLDDISLTKKRV